MVVAVIRDGRQNRARVLVGVHTALDSEETYIRRWVRYRIEYIYVGVERV